MDGCPKTPEMQRVFVDTRIRGTRPFKLGKQVVQAQEISLSLSVPPFHGPLLL